MSVRQSIDNAIYVALNASTDIEYVSRELDAWWEWKPDGYPGVMFVGGEEEKSRLAYPSSTSPDMQSIYPFEIRGYTRNIKTTDRIDEQRSALSEAVEKAIVGSTALGDLVKDVTPTGQEMDAGGLTDNDRGMVMCHYEATYFYNHNSP